MKRTDAVAVLQNILINFSGRSIDSFGFIRPKEGDMEALGYKLYIKGIIDQASKERILLLAKKCHLTVKEDNGLVIYESQRPDCQVNG